MYHRLRLLIYGIVLVACSLAPACAVTVTVGEARALLDTTPVTLTGKIVSAVFPSEGCIYVQESKRQAGIRVTSGQNVSVGDIVDVTGVMSTRRDGDIAIEREVSPATVTKTSSGASPKPLGMTCSSLGGGSVGSVVPGVKDGVGLNNIGLLVKIAGRVSYKSGTILCADDGSGVEGPYGSRGIVVSCPSDVPVSVGDMISVVGIVTGSVQRGWGANYRCILAREARDIAYVSGLALGSISGAVRDSSGNGIAGATVTTDIGGYLATTSSGGTYTIPNVTPGIYNLTASAIPYTSQTTGSLVVPTGGSASADFTLDLVYNGGFVANGDFEGAFTNGVANGWTTWQGSWSNQITFSRDSVWQMAGNYAQKWGRSDSRRLHGGLVKTLQTVPGATYEVIAWLRMDAADPSSWMEAGVDTTGQVTNGEASTISYTKLETSGNRKWLRYRKLITATGASVSFFTKFGHYSESAGPNWAYVDNVSIQPRIELEAEDYTTAYDTTPGNIGGAYRGGDVDIAPIPSGGYAAGWCDPGEWLQWSNITATGGDYAVVVDYSAGGTGNGAVNVTIDGANLLGTITLPRTGSWDGYRRVYPNRLVHINPGTHTARLTISTGGCNIDRVSLIPANSILPIKAVDYLLTYDTTPGNSGGKYRAGDADIDLGSEGYFVTNTAPGEWLEYPVTGDGRTYMAVLRYASSGTSRLNLQLNGNNVTGSLFMLSTGGSQAWKWGLVTPAFTLGTGANILRLNIEQSPINIESINLIPLGDGGGGSDLLAGVHFAGAPGDGINDMAITRGAGQWIYSTEFFLNWNREPEDPAFIGDATNWINGYLKPLIQNRIHPIVRIDYISGETVPRLKSDGTVDDAAVDRYVRTFTKFAQICEANGVPVRQFVVANEVNLKGEANGFTNGYIPEWYYAYVYDRVRAAMTALGPGYEVLVAGLSPGSFSVDPRYTPPTPDEIYNVLSVDSLVYLDNVVQELKRRGTQNVGFALHGYANFDATQNYTISFLWSVRKQLEIIEKTHTVVPYGQTSGIIVPGYANAPVYITEWNRHTPQNSADGRVFQETQTAGFIRTAITQIARWNRNREVYDNVVNAWRTYDKDGIQHNFHPIKGMTYFLFDMMGGSWGDYSLKVWHTLDGSATGADDMYNAYQSMIGWRDPSGR